MKRLIGTMAMAATLVGCGQAKPADGRFKVQPWVR